MHREATAATCSRTFFPMAARSFLPSSDGRPGTLRFGSLDSQQARRILADVGPSFYAEPGYLFFAREQTIMGIPFDNRALQTAGAATPVVGRMGGTFSASLNGQVVYRTADPLRQLTWFTPHLEGACRHSDRLVHTANRPFAERTLYCP